MQESLETILPLHTELWPSDHIKKLQRDLLTTRAFLAFLQVCTVLVSWVKTLPSTLHPKASLFQSPTGVRRRYKLCVFARISFSVK